MALPATGGLEIATKALPEARQGWDPSEGPGKAKGAVRAFTPLLDG